MVDIRKAEMADIPQLIGIDRITFPRETSWYSSNAFTQFMLLAGETFFVAYDEEKIVGFSITGPMQSNPKRAHGVKLAVLPEYQGTGISTRLWSNTRYNLRLHGIEWIQLQARPENEKARRIYQNWGFEEAQYLENYFGPGENVIIMECDLTC